MTASASPMRALIEAAVALADTLARENAALRALDLAGAMALLADKQAGTAAFAAAHARAAALGAPPGGAERALAETVGARLRALGDENRLLLERAIRVQGRIIGSIARALPRALGGAPRYDASGGIAGAARPGPVALSARA